MRLKMFQFARESRAIRGQKATLTESTLVKNALMKIFENAKNHHLAIANAMLINRTTKCSNHNKLFFEHFFMIALYLSPS